MKNGRGTAVGTTATSSHLGRPNVIFTNKHPSSETTNKEHNNKGLTTKRFLVNDHQRILTFDNVNTETTNQEQTRTSSVKGIEKSAGKADKYTESTTYKEIKADGSKLKTCESLTEISTVQLNQTGLGQTELEPSDNVAKSDISKHLKQTTSASKQDLIVDRIEERDNGVQSESSEKTGGIFIAKSKHTDVEDTFQRSVVCHGLNTTVNLQSCVNLTEKELSVTEKNNKEWQAAEERKECLELTSEENENKPKHSCSQKLVCSQEDLLSLAKKDVIPRQRKMSASGNSNGSAEHTSNHGLSDDCPHMRDSHFISCLRRSSRLVANTSKGMNDKSSLALENDKNLKWTGHSKLTEKKQCLKKTSANANTRLRTTATIKQPPQHYGKNIKGKQSKGE